jgi:hypothetical protein
MADTNTGANIGERAHELAGSARQTAQEAKNTLQQGAAAAGKRAQEVAANISRKTEDLASAAGEQAEGALSSVGQGMSSLAGTIRERAPHEGMVGSTATAVAEGLDTGGRYLQEHGLSDMTEDLASLIRTYPKTSLGVAFTLGWLFGMSCRR